MADAFMRRSAPAHICDTNSASSLHLPQARDLRDAALYRIELAEYLACLARNRIGNGGNHAPPLLRGGMLRAAEPARRRDRADVGEHRLKAAGAAQAIHLVAVRRVGGMLDPVEMHELRPLREHRKRLDLPAMGQAVAALAIELLRDVAGLDR